MITRSCGGRPILPPGFNVWEQPKHERTVVGQKSRGLTINVPAAGFWEVGFKMRVLLKTWVDMVVRETSAIAR